MTKMMNSTKSIIEYTRSELRNLVVVIFCVVILQLTINLLKICIYNSKYYPIWLSELILVVWLNVGLFVFLIVVNFLKNRIWCNFGIN